MVEELARRLVGPVDVFDDEDNRPLDRGEKRDERLEQSKLRAGRIAGLSVWLSVRELRKQLGELPTFATKTPNGCGAGFGTEEVSNRLDERQVRQGELGLTAATPEDFRVEPPRLAGELRREPGLPDARLAREDDKATLEPRRSQEGALEDRKLFLPANEDRRDNPFDHAGIVSGRRCAVDRVRLGCEAVELERSELGGELRGTETASTSELVCGRGHQLEQRVAGLGPLCRRRDPEGFEHVTAAGQRRRPETQQCIRTSGERGRDLAGDGEDLSPLFEREVGGDEGTAALARLDDDRRGAQARDDPVARRKLPRCRFDTGLVPRHDQGALGDFARE